MPPVTHSQRTRHAAKLARPCGSCGRRTAKTPGFLPDTEPEFLPVYFVMKPVVGATPFLAR
eukprot:1606218-Prymnesium_polylepis.1